MSAADEILAALLADLDAEHPRYLFNGMRLCYWCAAPWFGADIPSNHHDDCPWARARVWGKRNAKKIRSARERGTAASKERQPTMLAPTSAQRSAARARGPIDVPAGQLL